MVDVHCHMQFHAFRKDRDEVIKRAFDAGVQTIINVGTQISSSETSLELARQYDKCFAIVGIHPHHADKPENEPSNLRGVKLEWENELLKLGKQPKVVAIGEIGLDNYSYKSNGIADPKLQKDLFIRQIEIAQQLNLPLQIHNRQAGEEVIKILKQNKSKLKNPPGMFHCFAGSMEVLKSALHMGFYIGFDGNVTYPGIAKGEKEDLKKLAQHTPLDRIVTETDSPYLTPVPKRGSRNEPQNVIIVGQFLANLKGISFGEFEAETSRNARTVFNLPK